MRYLRIAVAVAVLLMGTLCFLTVVKNHQSKPDVAVMQQAVPAEKPVNTMPEGEQTRRLDYLESRVNTLERDFEELARFDPEFILARLDKDLKATESGYGETHGSFTDWFAPQLSDARKAGASAKEVNARLDRVYTLAKQGKYLSGYLQTVDEEGPGALKKYIDAQKVK